MALQYVTAWFEIFLHLLDKPKLCFFFFSFFFFLVDCRCERQKM